MSFNDSVAPEQKGEKMINKVSFTGRETLLTEKLAKPVEQQVVRASTYIAETVMPKSAEVVETAEQALSRVYASPYAPIGEAVKPATAGEKLFIFG